MMTRITEQLEQLITERHDGHLSAAELAEVERAVGTNADAAALARRYERLSRLLGVFRALPAGVDLTAFEKSVSKQVADEAAYQASIGADAAIDPDSAAAAAKPTGPLFDPLKQQFKQVDELVHGKFRAVPQVDWHAFRNRVSAAVRSEAEELARAGGKSAAAGRLRQTRRLRWVVRAAVPLAAAAAVLLIVVGRIGMDSPPPTPVISPDRTAVAVDVLRPRATGTVLVTFDRSPPPEAVHVPERGGIIIATKGIAPPANDNLEMALLF